MCSSKNEENKSLTSNSTMAFFMLSTSKIILISPWTGLDSLDLVPALAVSLFTASSSCTKNTSATKKIEIHKTLDGILTC